MNVRNSKTVGAVILALSLAISAGAAIAGSGTNSSATDIIRQLAPVAPQSQSTLAPKAKRPVTVRVVSPEANAVKVVIDRSRSLDFDVYFDFDSASLNGEARASLRELGRALASPDLADYDFLIAGHTDAKGSDAYNADLSARRALAVRAYLIDAFPIRADRLYTAGFGEEQLRDPSHPHAGVNRRVEVALIAAAD